MTNARKGDWVQTYRGGQFWPLDPRADEVHPEDLAHALAHQCRFGGHCLEFYSVAQHSVLAVDVARAHGADVRMQLAVLLHDGAEAYVVDVPRPLKQHLKGYKDVEIAVQDAVFARFGLALDAVEHRFIRHCDDTMLATEKRDLMAPTSAAWAWLPPPAGQRISAWGPREARDAFATTLMRLLRERT